MAEQLRVLMVEDSEDDALLVLRELRRGGFEPLWERVVSVEELEAALARGPWDLVLSDYVLPGFTGLDALATFKEMGLDAPFILVSGKIGEETAVEAMVAGARDYIMKSNLQRLVPAIRRELKEAAGREERRRAAATIQRLASFPRLNPDPVLELDASGEVIYANPAAARALREAGMPGDPKLFLPGDLHVILHPERVTVAKPQSREVSLGSRVFWVTVAPIPEFGTARIYGTDITELRQAEERLQLAALVIEKSPALAFRWSPEPGWPVVYVSENVRNWGYSPEEFAARTRVYADIIHGEDLPRVREEVARQTGSGAERFSQDYRIVTRDGSVRWVDDRTAVERDERGEVKFYQGVVVDITERKQAEQALQRLNRSLRTLSACNERLVHAKDEQTLLFDICRLIVEIGGYSVAWVGYARGGTLEPMAWAGDPGGRSGVTAKAILRGEYPVREVIGAMERCEQVLCREPGGEGNGEARKLCAALPLSAEDGVLGALVIHSGEEDAFDPNAMKLLAELADDLAYGVNALRREAERLRAEKAVVEGERRLRTAMVQTIQAIALALEKRDPYTAGHQRRVAELSTAIAHALGLEEEVVQGIQLGASIHDFGKLYVPAEVLNRPGSLPEIEMALIRSHPAVAHDVIQGVEFPWPAGVMILQHHERLDGTGYPNGLKGEEIILGARIIAVADVVEAMASRRPYRGALGIEAALREIQAGKGSLYDPAVVEACVSLFRERGFKFSSVEPAT